jgi:hypothetical protein
MLHSARAARASGLRNRYSVRPSSTCRSTTATKSRAARSSNADHGDREAQPDPARATVSTHATSTAQRVNE